jgi:hypothetical protein
MPERLQEHKGALAPSANPFWAEPRFVFSAIAIYLAVQFPIRLTHWPTLAADDSEQTLLSQWSYRPPFMWLPFAINQVASYRLYSEPIGGCR